VTQPLNICAIDIGTSILKVTCTALHKTWQSDNQKISVESSQDANKIHNLFPLQFRLAKLSLVSTTPRFKYHIKILIRSGAFSFQNIVLCLTRVSVIKALYIELTLNIRFWRRPQMNLSCTSFSLICATLATSLNHKVRLLTTSPLQKAMFSGIEQKTDATETFLRRVIAYSDGYCCRKVKFSNHLSSQK
jgi:hypothetical protein